jgi:hypothetical protein
VRTRGGGLVLELDNEPTLARVVTQALIAADWLSRDPLREAKLERATLAVMLAVLAGDAANNIEDKTFLENLDPGLASAQQKRDALQAFGISLM